MLYKLTIFIIGLPLPNNDIFKDTHSRDEREVNILAI